MLQDLWLKIESLPPSGPVANPRAYLFRMANNLVLDRVRGRQRAMRRDHAWIEAEHGSEGASPEERSDPAEPADVTIARRQEAEILARAIDDLPDGAARALRLYRFDGLGQAEIASVMGISRSGVEKHLALAMKKLRMALLDCGLFAGAASNGHGAENVGETRKEQGQ